MLKSRFCIVLLALLATLSSPTFSQNKYDCLTDSIFSFKHDTTHLFAHVEMHQFLKNNEYFNPIVEGYTLLGTIVRPGIYFTPSAKTKIYAGASALWYDGDKAFEYVQPEFSIQYNFSNTFTMIVGSLPSMQHHTIAPMLLNSERFLTKPTERGLEFLMKKRHIDWNSWLSWEQFLHSYEHSQEHIFVGTSLEYRPIVTERFALGIPFQFTAYHEGGQINDVWFPMQMMFNNAFGIHPMYMIGKTQLSLSYLFLGFKDLASHSILPYQHGDGHFVRSSIASKHIRASVSYWQGFQFYDPVGEQIYSSVSQTIPLANPSTDQKNRQLLIYEFYYTNILAKNLNLLCGVELFHDLINALIDYNYSLSLRYSGDFCLRKR